MCESVGMIFHFLFHLVKMFKSYFGVEYKAVDLVWVCKD